MSKGIKSVKKRNIRTGHAWTMKTGRGFLLPWAVYPRRKDCVSAFATATGVSWDIWKQRGYTCVRIQMVEV